MILYSIHTSPRFLYMAEWLGERLFGKPLEVVSNLVKDETAPILNYSDTEVTGSYHVMPSGLLFESGIRRQDIQLNPGEAPYFFASNGDHPFDLLSASFFLLSRYEEYLPYQKDMYGRYAHENSLAYRNEFLKRPLIDEWIADLKQRLKTFFPELIFTENRFNFIPTYDIDIAWSYRGKSFTRQLGGAIKQLFRGNWKALEERRKVADGSIKDPFDVFDELDELHSKYQLKPIYFFLLAEKVKGYDKNISPNNKPFRLLIEKLAARYDAGIHLSWQARSNLALMQNEKGQLEKIIGRKVESNRMHYIKFDLPQTFRQLIQLGINQDYSMGYGSINGFRASTSHPFFWYDLELEQETTLQLIPFCYMEANSIFEQKDDVATAFQELEYYLAITRATGGTLSSIFHNHLIGYNSEGRKWWEFYKMFLGHLNG